MNFLMAAFISGKIKNTDKKVLFRIFLDFLSALVRWKLIYMNLGYFYGPQKALLSRKRTCDQKLPPWHHCRSFLTSSYCLYWVRLWSKCNANVVFISVPLTTFVHRIRNMETVNPHAWIWISILYMDFYDFVKEFIRKTMRRQILFYITSPRFS